MSGIEGRGPVFHLGFAAGEEFLCRLVVVGLKVGGVVRGTSEVSASEVGVGAFEDGILQLEELRDVQPTWRSELVDAVCVAVGVSSVPNDTCTHEILTTQWLQGSGLA